MPTEPHADMCVLAFAAQKGGVGKTTLVGHMAVAAAQAGIGPIGLIDMDPQASLAKWMESREAKNLHLFTAEHGSINAALREAAAAGMRLVMVDTPPAVTRAISEVVAQADLVIIPTRPSPHDLRAVGATVDIAEWHGKPLIFVVNGATARARITADAAVALSQHGTVAPVTVHHRVDFAASMIDGRTVLEAKPDGKSAGEITNLWAYLATRLERLQPAQESAPGGTALTYTGNYASNINALGRQAPAFGRRVGQ
ncbi:MAG: ParA family protein [Parvibaculum sp.]